MVLHTLYGMIGIPLVIVNDCYGPPNLIMNAGTLYLSMTVLITHTLHG